MQRTCGGHASQNVLHGRYVIAVLLEMVKFLKLYARIQLLKSKYIR